MSKCSWFSANEDGEVVAKTDIKDDGTVRRYDYTVPDDIKQGHGDTWYESVENFLEDKPTGSRSKDAPDSIKRRWYGNGFNLTLDELKTLREELIGRQLHTAKELMLKLK